MADENAFSGRRQAMFLVGAGSQIHAIPPLHHLTTAYACRLSLFGSLLSTTDIATAAAGN